MKKLLKAPLGVQLSVLYLVLIVVVCFIAPWVFPAMLLGLLFAVSVYTVASWISDNR